MAETGQFAILWRGIADKFKSTSISCPRLAPWRDLEQIEAKLVADPSTRSIGHGRA